jgi:hypothetical protein
MAVSVTFSLILASANSRSSVRAGSRPARASMVKLSVSVV